jgi:anti-sigma factor RsiW
MKTHLCQLLNDYLDHDLEPDEKAHFVAHLSECRNCRQAVANHRRLKNLLEEAVRLEPIPESLIPKIEARLGLRRWRRWIAGSAALAATAATIWLITHHFPRTPDQDLSVVKVATQPTGIKASSSPVPVRISFPADANVLVMREKSESPNITIVHVYTGLMTESARPEIGESKSSIRERSEP